MDTPKIRIDFGTGPAAALLRAQYEFVRELYLWGRRVRRDILALEIWCKQQDGKFQHGGGPTQRPPELDERIDQLLEKWNRLFPDLAGGDPGDPPEGPFD